MPTTPPNEIPDGGAPTSPATDLPTSATARVRENPPKRPTFAEVFGPYGRRFVLAVIVLTLVLINGWMGVVRGTIADALFSYTVLIPAICVWLFWLQPPDNARAPDPRPVAATVLLLLAAAIAAAGTLALRDGWITSNTSWLSTQMAAWVVGVWGAAALFLGGNWISRHLFALGFLLFTIPLPDPAVDRIELFLQSASAMASEWLFAASRTPYLREDMAFWLPGVHIQVAPECSGIRSTLVLFITAILGSYLLLRRNVHRTAIVLAIVPLGIFRNALRILTLTLLSIHVNPEIMHSALHRRGGPLFFAISLAPLFAMFWWFGRREKAEAKRP